MKILNKREEHNCYYINTYTFYKHNNPDMHIEVHSVKKSIDYIKSNFILLNHQEMFFFRLFFMLELYLHQ